MQMFQEMETDVVCLEFPAVGSNVAGVQGLVLERLIAFCNNQNI